MTEEVDDELDTHEPDFDVFMTSAEGCTTRSQSQGKASSGSKQQLEKSNDKQAEDEQEKQAEDKKIEPAAPSPIVLTEPVRALKLMLYNVNDYNELNILAHRRQQPRGGNLDVNGIMMMPGESLHDAVLRCIAYECDDHPVVHDAAGQALEAFPDGHHTFDMRVHGVTNRVTVLCVHVPKGEATGPASYLNMTWIVCRTIWQTARWFTGDNLHGTMVTEKFSLAMGIREALITAGCVGEAVPTSPRGFFSIIDAQAGYDVGRFSALSATLSVTFPMLIPPGERTVETHSDFFKNLGPITTSEMHTRYSSVNV